LIDLATLLAAGITFSVGVLFVISFATKLVAIYLGATYRIRQLGVFALVTFGLPYPFA
jgi:hypothetical protein